MKELLTLPCAIDGVMGDTIAFELDPAHVGFRVTEKGTPTSAYLDAEGVRQVFNALGIWLVKHGGGGI